MNERKKDFVLGVLSLIFVAFVFYFYFLKMFTFMDIAYQISENLNEKNFIVYQQKQHNSCHVNIDKPTIILRMDDARAYSVPLPYLTEEVLKRNMSLTLGVIPQELENDKNFQLLLVNLKKNPNIEIAQHGNHHDERDENISEESLVQGYVKIENLIGVKPMTYIPPYNKISESSMDMISKYFSIISGREHALKEGDFAEIGTTMPTYDYPLRFYVSIPTLVNTCRQSLENVNLCVITFHPQEYSEDMGQSTISEAKLNEFKQLLDKLQELNATYANFNDIVYCSEDSNATML